MTHTCTVCATTGEWGPSWSWFGSLIDVDNGRNVPKFCGDVCRDQWAADNGRYLAEVGAGKPSKGRRAR